MKGRIYVPTESFRTALCNYLLDGKKSITEIIPSSCSNDLMPSAYFYLRSHAHKEQCCEIFNHLHHSPGSRLILRFLNTQRATCTVDH
ncbi:hypothetical protein CPB83DRAFT_201565 [Crepidotus variabilis]|uniref:Uncharacterized protein n=1 Tax=Crepidotus variabilis TaxID=179855 RepID=A0A9P6EJB7_9AGAR|nr:hypothetical protein CPB83DRAFT_201565 [Crepidotus variabilis]